MKAVIQNIQHRIIEGVVELTVIVPMSSEPLESRESLLPLLRALSPKQIKQAEDKAEKEYAKREREYDKNLEGLLKSIRLGAVELNYVANKAEARKLVYQCASVIEPEERMFRD